MNERKTDYEGVWPLLPGEKPPAQKTFPACTGACEQGHRPCVTPQACQVAEDESESEFGAIECVARYGPHMGLMWVVIGVIGVAIWAVWW